MQDSTAFIVASHNLLVAFAQVGSQSLRREVPIDAAVQDERAANGRKNVVHGVALAGDVGGVVFIGLVFHNDVWFWVKEMGNCGAQNVPGSELAAGGRTSMRWEITLCSFALSARHPRRFLLR